MLKTDLVKNLNYPIFRNWIKSLPIMGLVITILTIASFLTPKSAQHYFKSASKKLDKSEIETFYKELNNSDLSYNAFQFALNGYYRLLEDKAISRDTILTIIDYMEPSNKERLFVVDLKNRKIIEQSLVAHGRETGELFAAAFSNSSGSHKSSLGFFITEDTYIGKHGYSLRMEGVEPGINDHAFERSLVFHGASYVSNQYITQYGRLGRSYGCPALPDEKYERIIDLIKHQSVVFVYYPSKDYFQVSQIFKADRNTP